MFVVSNLAPGKMFNRGDVPVLKAKRRGGRDADLSSVRRLPNDGNSALFQFPFAITDEGMMVRRKRLVRFIDGDLSDLLGQREVGCSNK